MMKRINGLKFGLILLVIFGSYFTHTTAYATLPDSAEDASENENSDATSTWGSTSNKVTASEAIVARPLAAIDESSFESGNNRAPSSMSRGPATVKEVQLKEAKPLPAPKTMIRALKQKKAFQEVAVIVNDLGFFPSTLFLTQGIPVRMFVTGASQRSQCIILDAFGVRRQIRNQKVEEVIFTPDEPGKFSFSCPMNGAKGTVIVKALEIERFPASANDDEAPVGKKTAKAPKAAPVADDINDDDFGIEFREK